MKDLYEILEVSPKASEEVIEKAYKVLAKKYHPDLQNTEAQKRQCEQKMKVLNEAYEILGDTEKRKQYDAQIKEKANVPTSNVPYQNTKTNTKSAKKQEGETPESIYDVYGQIQYYRDTLKKQAKKQEQMQEQAQSAYQYAYEKYLKNLGFKVKKPWSWRRAMDLLKALGIMALIVLVLWIFPPTRNWMISFYEENIIIKALVDFIGNFFHAMAMRIG